MSVLHTLIAPQPPVSGLQEPEFRVVSNLDFVTEFCLQGCASVAPLARPAWVCGGYTFLEGSTE